MLLHRSAERAEQVANPPAVEGPEVAGEPGGADRLGLGQVVPLRFLGQPGLDHVERSEVGAVLLGPVDPDPHQGSRGQIDADRVVRMTGEHQEGERGTPVDGHPVAVLDRSGHPPSGAAARRAGRSVGHQPSASSWRPSTPGSPAGSLQVPSRQT